MKGRLHYHAYLSAWRDGKPPRALFDVGAYYHRKQANRRKQQVTDDPRDRVVVLQCEHPSCCIKVKGGKVPVELA